MSNEEIVRIWNWSEREGFAWKDRDLGLGVSNGTARPHGMLLYDLKA